MRLPTDSLPNAPNIQESRLATTREVAARYKVHPRTIQSWVSAGFCQPSPLVRGVSGSTSARAIKRWKNIKPESIPRASMAPVHLHSRAKDLWYCAYKLANAQKVFRSTGQKDKEKAQVICQFWQIAKGKNTESRIFPGQDRSPLPQRLQQHKAD